jgi:hypothetical protein
MRRRRRAFAGRLQRGIPSAIGRENPQFPADEGDARIPENGWW